MLGNVIYTITLSQPSAQKHNHIQNTSAHTTCTYHHIHTIACN